MMNKLKYIFWVAFVLFVILTMHIGYQYVIQASPKTPGKGGTFVEATFHDVSYIPYLGDQDQDPYYQAFFFDACVNIEVTGSKIDYKDDLCKVNTNDFKTFTVQLLQDKKRSDGMALTLDDIERTYSSLLINNSWKISKFDTYKSIDIRRKGNSLILTFPTASYDNFIFFTNFILPQHILSKQNLTYYASYFVKNPVVSQCAQIDVSTSDDQSLLINTKNCDKMYFNYYQVKKFETPLELQKYIGQGNQNTLDLYIDPMNISGYQLHTLLTSIYPTIFFNTKSDRLTPNNRLYIAHILHQNLFSQTITPLAGSTNTATGQILSGSRQDGSGTDMLTASPNPLPSLIQNDRFLFDYFPSLSGVTYNKNNQALASTATINNTLPPSIYIKGSGKKFFYQLGNIKDRVELSMRFDVAYQKVSISANNGPEYIPESYQATGKKLQYNIAPKYGNIKLGHNVYVVRGYGSGDIPFKIATITITYKQSETTPQSQTRSLGRPLRFVYHKNDANEVIVARIQEIMKYYRLEDQFEYIATGTDELSRIIQDRNYDIILQNLNLGIKKDVSGMFATDNANVNPSLYQNSELSSYISQYFIANKKIKSIVKQGIDDIYTKDIPLLIIGKLHQSLWIKDTIQIKTSDRMYHATSRKDFLSDIYFVDQVDPQRSELLKLSNIYKFIKQAFVSG